MTAAQAPATPPAPPRGPAAAIDRAASGLLPAYFSLVMATGIVSLAAWTVGVDMLGPWCGHFARGLFWLNLVFFAALWALTLLRVARHRARLLADVSDHNRGVGFFTAVPAACVLGTQTLLIADSPGAAWALWGLGAFLWVLITYTVFTALTVKAVKPALADGLSGGWLVSIVATQSVSVLAAQLASAGLGAAPAGPAHDAMLFLALVLWLGGAMLYVWIISLIFYRYTFFPFKPSDLSPPYWINMGAMAISTLAGATLLLSGRDSSLIVELTPFIKGATLLFWATATWWIPMLVILGVWRHIIKKFPLRYDPLYWGAVFPLGMYAVATTRMARALNLPVLLPLPRGFLFVALAAWTLTLAGLIHRLVRGLSPSPNPPAPRDPRPK
ncbi:MAG: tellurite resistance/C4-dicarboxylate transporter family protein [Phycisphaerales bacterium]|nr:tellurite resistance/C4-dicarboxylate transporter family protein [Phycisphaerales bacterium]